MIEYEQRYKVHDVETMLDRLEQHGVTIKEELHVIDRWQMPHSVHEQADHDRFFDGEHGIAYRIRFTQKLGDVPKLILDLKQHTEADNHNSFREELIMEDDEAAMLKFLDDKGYYNWLTVDKLRRRFSSQYEHLDIVMDTIAGVKDSLGIDTVLEVEFQGDATRDEALAAIESFASEVGLTTADLFEKSLTTESMPILAHFK